MRALLTIPHEFIHQLVLSLSLFLPPSVSFDPFAFTCVLFVSSSPLLRSLLSFSPVSPQPEHSPLAGVSCSFENIKGAKVVGKPRQGKGKRTQAEGIRESKEGETKRTATLQRLCPGRFAARLGTHKKRLDLHRTAKGRTEQARKEISPGPTNSGNRFSCTLPRASSKPCLFVNKNSLKICHSGRTNSISAFSQEITHFRTHLANFV